MDTVKGMVFLYMIEAAASHPSIPIVPFGGIQEPPGLFVETTNISYEIVRGMCVHHEAFRSSGSGRL
jgi:hypothetical protein